jgi:CBS domain-containing protein
MLISEIYHPEPVTISQNETIESAIRQMYGHEYNGFVVVDDKGKVVGVLSLQDIAAATVPKEFQSNISLPLAMYKRGFFQERCGEVKKQKVKEIMRRNYTEVTLDTNILAVSADFLKNDLYIVPVFGEGKLLGIITRTEIKKALARGMEIIQ